MTIEPIIFFDMAIIIFVLAIALVGMVFYFSHVIKKISQDSTNPGSTSNSSLLDESRQKAARIIDEANSKATDIVNKANLSTDIASANFTEQIKRVSSSQIKEFEKVTADFMKQYSQVLKDLKSKNIEVFQNTSKDIELSVMEEIKGFKESVEKLTLISQQTVKKRIETDYKDAKTEIDNYKKEELKKIEDNIYKLLERVSKLTLGKTLNLSEHEDLIEKSLEKAKKEGMFET